MKCLGAVTVSLRVRSTVACRQNKDGSRQTCLANTMIRFLSAVCSKVFNLRPFGKDIHLSSWFSSPCLKLKTLVPLRDLAWSLNSLMKQDRSLTIKCNEDIKVLVGLFAVLEFPIGQWQDPKITRGHLLSQQQTETISPQTGSLPADGSNYSLKDLQRVLHHWIAGSYRAFSLGCFVLVQRDRY